MKRATVTDGPGPSPVALGHERNLASLRRHVAALGSLPADRLDAPVPTCPGWDVGTLVAHCGAVHEWVVGWLRDEDPNPGYDHRMDTTRGPGVLEWYRTTGTLLADLLEEAGPDRACGTFLGPGRSGFWTRRQANELLVHRWDAEAALGGAGPLDPEEALDGIDEWATVFVPRLRRKVAAEDGAPSVALVAEPGAWLVERPPGEVRTTRVDPAAVEADAVVRGRPQDVLLTVWHRGEPDRTTVEGDAAAVTSLLDPARIR